MSKKSFFENKNPGSLDFIENSLNENSKNLETLLDEVKLIAERIRDTPEPSILAGIQKNLTSLQMEVENIMKFLRTQTQQNRIPFEAEETKKVSPNSPEFVQAGRLPIVLRCKTWQDFKTTASGAETVSFMVRESEKIFEADALKGNQIIAFVGEIPDFSQLLKLWLGNHLEIAEEKVFEGTLTRA